MQCNSHCARFSLWKLSWMLLQYWHQLTYLTCADLWLAGVDAQRSTSHQEQHGFRCSYFLHWSSDCRRCSQCRMGDSAPRSISLRANATSLCPLATTICNAVRATLRLSAILDTLPRAQPSDLALYVPLEQGACLTATLCLPPTTLAREKVIGHLLTGHVSMLRSAITHIYTSALSSFQSDRTSLLHGHST